MNHVRTISRMPVQASTSICDNITSEYEARLCFVYEFVLNIIKPILDILLEEKFSDEEVPVV